MLKLPRFRREFRMARDLHFLLRARSGTPRRERRCKERTTAIPPPRADEIMIYYPLKNRQRFMTNELQMKDGASKATCKRAARAQRRALRRSFTIVIPPPVVALRHRRAIARRLRRVRTRALPDCGRADVLIRRTAFASLRDGGHHA